MSIPKIELSVTDLDGTFFGAHGTPLAGETIGGRRFDGLTETAVFPGDLPDDPAAALTAGAAVRFVRFRPPKLERDGRGLTLSLPHIRLDRALEFLLGDRLA